MNYTGSYSHSSNDIYHHGRLGMKWYQHIFGKDRSSSSGRKKSVKPSKSKQTNANTSKNTTKKAPASSALAKLHAKAQAKQITKKQAQEKQKAEADAINDRKLEYKQAKKKGGVSTVSDQELANRIKRMQMEKQYRDLLNEDEREGTKVAEKMVKAAVMKSGQDILNQVTYYAFASMVNTAASSAGLTKDGQNLVRSGSVIPTVKKKKDD